MSYEKEEDESHRIINSYREYLIALEVCSGINTKNNWDIYRRQREILIKEIFIYFGLGDGFREGVLNLAHKRLDMQKKGIDSEIIEETFPNEVLDYLHTSNGAVRDREKLEERKKGAGES